MQKKLSKEAQFLLDCRDPFFFIKSMWGLEIQPCYRQYEQVMKDTEPENWKAEWFGEQIDGKWAWIQFQKGKHITWQQAAIIEGARRSVSAYGEVPNKIAVKSGNGIGKSCVSAWLVPWFLFSFKHAQVPCTAPTSSQMNDVLWKEIALWINRMPDIYSELFDCTSSYIRIKADPESWFARARTSRKESPEAFSGVHADAVLAIEDEASGVPDIIVEYGAGIKTSPFWLWFMFSNPTRNVGHFRNAFKKGSGWRQYTFNSNESPVVDPGFVQEKIDDSGLDSDDYRKFVLGEFPNADSMDDSGFVPLFTDQDIESAMTDSRRVPVKIQGIDPSGEGNDKTAFVGRDAYVAQILSEEAISTPKSIAARGATFIAEYGIEKRKTVIDSFGSGSDVSQELALQGFEVQPLNVGIPANDPKKFMNKRAELFWIMREWIKKGGQLVRDDRWKELLNLRYRYNESGKLQIMGKEKMRKDGIPSPNFADAFMLTFAVPDAPVITGKRSKPKKYDVYD